LETFEGFYFHLLAANGEDFVDGAVADDLAHDCLGEVAQGGLRL
jgi:hypothetical protein